MFAMDQNKTQEERVLDAADAGEGALVAFLHDGERLTEEHGDPWKEERFGW